MSETKTILFQWDLSEFDAMVAACDHNDEVLVGLPWLPKSGLILEAGAGSGRVVKYLQDRGYHIEGIELAGDVVADLNRLHPELRIRKGDVAHIDKPDDYYDGILSFGVIEHFVEGMQSPLREHLRVLKPGGIAVITVPSFNTLRRIKYFFALCFGRCNPRMNNVARRLFGKKPMVRNRRGHGFQFHVYPQFLGFFEYRLKPREFEALCRACGFKILASVPIAHLDGIYHEFGEHIIKFRNWQFFPSPLAVWLNRIFSRIAFFHNHMHAIIATKEAHAPANSE